jgi:hypothetical protein
MSSNKDIENDLYKIATKFNAVPSNSCCICGSECDLEDPCPTCHRVFCADCFMDQEGDLLGEEYVGESKDESDDCPQCQLNKKRAETLHIERRNKELDEELPNSNPDISNKEFLE